jgi:chromosomal replication initiation ATPase DnaA
MDQIKRLVNEAVREMLISDLDRDRPTPLQPHEDYVWHIINLVVEYYDADILETLSSSNRHKTNMLAKQVAMFFIRKDYGYDSPTLGKIFNIDRTTVIYAIKKIDQWMGFDPQMQIEYIELRKLINNIYETR